MVKPNKGLVVHRQPYVVEIPGQVCIVRAETHEQAALAGAKRLHTSSKALNLCIRAPWLDSVKRQTLLALYRMGWVFTCRTCGKRLCKNSRYGHSRRPRFIQTSAFCTKRCEHRYVVERLKEDANHLLEDRHHT